MMASALVSHTLTPNVLATRTASWHWVVATTLKPTGGLKYDANNIYRPLSTPRPTTRPAPVPSGFANKAQNFEVVAQYQFDFGLRPSVAYLQSKGKDLEGYGDQDILKYVDVGATYYFNKNMSTYVDYKINLLDDNSFTHNAGISTDDVVALGPRVYQF